MANKYHRQGFSKGKLVTETVKKAREAFKNIYKTNKKKENVVDQLNKNLQKQRKKTFDMQEFPLIRYSVSIVFLVMVNVLLLLKAN